MPSIAGFGHDLPEGVIDNAALAAELGVTEDWIFQVSGIRTRRCLAPGETACDLAHRAALACLADAGMTPADLGGIVVGTGTPPRQFPGVSADLQKRMSVPGIPAFDIHLASVGGFFALATASALCAQYGPILAVGAEAMTTVMARAPRVKETAILFGDGAGAALVCPGDGPIMIEDIRIASDGTFADSLSMDFGETLRMDGRTVILQANRKLKASISELLSRNGLAVEDVGLFLFHQANLNLLRQVGNALKIDPEKVFVDIDKYGNTSAASLLIAMSEAKAEGRLSPGTRVVLAAFGAGMGWGAALLSCRA
ncbi:MAG TPA: ketoacyl-ACP synthase III [Candidatus Deferrimicrobiaceae bacterium]|jgi:3-oxoacyl-[acyl-carrier-protein] synthase-3